MLLYTELHCAGKRRGFPAELIIMYAAAMPGKLRSADAIHLATAIRLQVDALAAYDSELVAAATDAGLNAFSPGETHLEPKPAGCRIQSPS